MFLQLSLTFEKKHDLTDHVFFFFKKNVAAETVATTIKKMSILGCSVFVLVERGVCGVLGRRGVCMKSSIWFSSKIP